MAGCWRDRKAWNGDWNPKIGQKRESKWDRRRSTSAPPTSKVFKCNTRALHGQFDFHSIKNMGKFRDLRSRFLVSLSAVKSIFATHGRVPSAAARRTGDGEDSDGEAMELHWNEARRIYSEPIGVLRHSSSNDSLVSSLASHDLQEAMMCSSIVSRNPRSPTKVSAVLHSSMGTCSIVHSLLSL